LDVADIQALMSALADLDAYRTLHPNLTDQDFLLVDDVDDDNSVSNRDIQALINLVASAAGGAPAGASLAAVPEPAGAVSGGIAAAGLATLGLTKYRRSGFQKLRAARGV